VAAGPGQPAATAGQPAYGPSQLPLAWPHWPASYSLYSLYASLPGSYSWPAATSLAAVACCTAASLWPVLSK